MIAPRFHRLLVAEIRPETADAVSVAFAVPPHLRDAFRFNPGQYLTLRATIDGAEERRSYSICAGADDDDLRIAVKRVEGGRVSAWVNEQLRAGDSVDVMTPGGRFGIDLLPGAGRTLLAFAAGSGITPILSILKTALAREPTTRFLLFYGNRSTSGIMFREQLEDLKDRHLARLSVFHVLSREQQDVAALNGRLDAARVQALLDAMVPLDAVDHAFVCGPQPMIEGIEKTLLDAGLPRARVHVERFTPAAGGRPRTPAVTTAARPHAIATVIHEGVRAVLPMAAGEAVIDAALRAGLDLPYSCKGGMCCTCRARVLEGRLEMAVNYSLEPWETDAGYILTCQARALTPTVTIDFDQV